MNPHHFGRVIPSLPCVVGRSGINDDGQPVRSGKNIPSVRSEESGFGLARVRSHHTAVQRWVKNERFSYVKRVILVACWLFATITFLIVSETKKEVVDTFVDPQVHKCYPIPQELGHTLEIIVQVNGPFITKMEYNKMYKQEILDWTAGYMTIWLERWYLKSGKDHISIPELTEEDAEKREKEDDTHNVGDEVKGDRSRNHVLLQKGKLDLNIADLNATVLLKLPKSLIRDAALIRKRKIYTICFTTEKTKKYLPFNFTYAIKPIGPELGAMVAILVMMYFHVLVGLEMVERVLAAIVVLTTYIAIMCVLSDRPTLVEIFSWLQVPTLLFIFGIMLLIAVASETGMYDAISVVIIRNAENSMNRISVWLFVLAACSSAVMDNITVTLLTTPLVIRICEIMRVRPGYILKTYMVFVNVGGMMGPFGAAPSIKIVQSGGISFAQYFLHMAPGTLLVLLQTSLQIYCSWYRNPEMFKVPERGAVHQRELWRRVVRSCPDVSVDWHAVKSKIKEESKVVTDPPNLGADHILKLLTFRKETLALGFSVIIILLQPLLGMKIPPAWASFLGIILLLVMLSKRDYLEPILHRIEWATLIYLGCIFVFGEVHRKFGIGDYFGSVFDKILRNPDMTTIWKLVLANFSIVLITGILSAFFNNVHVASWVTGKLMETCAQVDVDIPSEPVLWALTFGCCLGGTGTLLGADVNVVSAGTADQQGHWMSYWRFFKFAMPIMVGNLVTAILYQLAIHTWWY